MIRTIIFIFFFALFGLYAQKLVNPESITYYPPLNEYLVSNIGVPDKMDGTIIAMDDKGNRTILIDGLQDPKGTVLAGDYLYVADVGKVVGINLKVKNSSWRMFPIDNAPNLHDICFDGKETLYVTDMIGKIYSINTRTSDIAEFKLKGEIVKPSGVLYLKKANSLLVISSNTTPYPIKKISLATGVVTDVITLDAPALDGIIADNAGNYYVTSHGQADKKYDGSVYKISADMTGTPLLVKKGLNCPADVCIDDANQRLVVLLMDDENSRIDYIDLKTIDTPAVDPNKANKKNPKKKK